MGDVDRAIVRATQSGLPLTPRPFAAVAEAVGVAESEVLERLRAMLHAGIVRRVAAVPNHYALGYTANGMSVWDVADQQVAELGRRVGELPSVSHCYRRPRRPPGWPYNLFAMVHGRTREEVEQRVGEIARVLGASARASDVLYSTRILKKTGMRLGA